MFLVLSLPAFRLPEAGPTRAAAAVYPPPLAAAPQPSAAFFRPGDGGWAGKRAGNKRPLLAERNQASESAPYGGQGGPLDSANYRPYAAPSPPPQAAPAGPPSVLSTGGGGERFRSSPTRKGKKRPKNAASKSRPGGAGSVGGYEINVYGPNGGRSYTIVDGLSPTNGRRHSGEELRGGGGYARPPRQVWPLPNGSEEDAEDRGSPVMGPWKNDKHWVGHSLHSQEADEDLPFLF